MVENLFPFLLAVIFVAINGLTQLAFAQGLGFKLKPTGLAFLVAAGISLFLGSVTPVSGQSAMIALAGRTEQERERVAALLIAAVVSTILGLTGAISSAVGFAGVSVMAGMMAGVGIMLAQIGVEFITDKQKGNFSVGMVSLVSALLIFGFFSGTPATPDSPATPSNPNILVYTVAGSVGISTAFYLVMKKIKGEALREDTSNESDDPKFWTKGYWTNGDWKLVKPKVTFRAILSAFALICLGIGVVTSFGAINQNMSGVSQNFDHLILITGLVDFIGVMFGGMPLEPIISGTAAAPWPIVGAFVLMLVLGVIALLGLVTKICKYMPVQSIAGFLVVIGFFETFLPNMVHGFRAGPRAGDFHGNLGEAAIAMGVTALTKNPFLGIIAGIAVRYIGLFFGVPLVNM